MVSSGAVAGIVIGSFLGIGLTVAAILIAVHFFRRRSSAAVTGRAKAVHSLSFRFSSLNQERERSNTAVSNQSEAYASVPATPPESQLEFSGNNEYAYVTSVQRHPVAFAQGSGAVDMAPESDGSETIKGRSSLTEQNVVAKVTGKSDQWQPLAVVSVYPEDLKQVTPTYTSLDPSTCQIATSTNGEKQNNDMQHQMPSVTGEDQERPVTVVSMDPEDLTQVRPTYASLDTSSAKGENRLSTVTGEDNERNSSGEQQLGGSAGNGIDTLHNDSSFQTPSNHRLKVSSEQSASLEQTYENSELGPCAEAPANPTTTGRRGLDASDEYENSDLGPTQDRTTTAPGNSLVESPEPGRNSPDSSCSASGPIQATDDMRQERCGGENELQHFGMDLTGSEDQTQQQRLHRQGRVDSSASYN